MHNNSLFLDNKYTTCYFSIISSRKQLEQSRINDSSYFEKHHIIPKSLGGLDITDNLVILTAREHYVCHLLLTKMTIGIHRNKMAYAFWGMANQQNSNQIRHKISSRMYSYSKKLLQKSLSDDRKDKSFDERFGKEKSDLIKAKFKLRKTRSSPNDIEKSNISARIKTASKDTPWTRNFEEQQPGNKICEKCNMVVDLGNYTRHHGDKCKRELRICPNCENKFTTIPVEKKTYCCINCYWEFLRKTRI